MEKKVVIRYEYDADCVYHLVLNDEQIKLLKFLEEHNIIDDNMTIKYLKENEDITWQDLTK